MEQLQYNWTVSSQRAQRELGWTASQSSRGSPRRIVAAKPGGRPEKLRAAYDDWGLDPDYIRAWGAWFWFLRNVYWRIDHEGLDNIPDVGRAMLVSNHRGFMPLDAVMHLSLILKHRGRIPRFLIIHSLLRPPFLCNFLTKLGGVIASQENAARLFAAENLVGIFPEGIRGAFSPYRRAYQLRDFSKSGFAKMAIENQVPVIPSAVIGHAEIFPILGRIDWSYITREGMAVSADRTDVSAGAHPASIQMAHASIARGAAARSASSRRGECPHGEGIRPPHPALTATEH